MTDSIINTPDHKTAYVVEGYLPNGGNFMAYHLGRILHLEFGYNVCILTNGSPQRGGANEQPFAYDPMFPCRTLSGTAQRLKDGDVLIANPSYSSHNFGLKAKGFKLMYIQGFTTFSLLDCFFDHYVTVSPFVHDFINNTYGIETRIIPPFLHDNLLANNVPLIPWEERAPFSLTLNLKGDIEQQLLLLARLRREIQIIAPDIEKSLSWDEAIEATRIKLPQKALFSRMASSRYFITLSVAEGFGLMPLEAMALGAVVMGFDGFGGRHYLRNGKNCGVSSFPDVSGLAKEIIRVVQEPEHAAFLAANGRETAKDYSYNTFRQAWISELKAVIPPA